MPNIAPISNAVHLCIDMQNLFAKGGVWETPWMERVLPNVIEIARLHTPRTVFTRFITPTNAEDRPGRWQHYYNQWPEATRAKLPATQLELVPSLARLAPPATVIDKPVYSAFAGSRLLNFLTHRNVATLIVTGTETDICVLSTVFDAIDLGFRVILVEDALCSSSDKSHDALMTMYRLRLTHQIELVQSDELPEFWIEG